MPIANQTKKKPNANQRKRVGAHHNKNKTYAKAYWPYLPVLVIAIVAVVINITWFNKGVLDYAIDTNSKGLLTSTNHERTDNNLQPLAMNDILSSAAQAKANDMVTRNYWSHVTPDGEQPWAFITEAGYSYQTAGENLAYGFATSQDTVTGWMNSPGHRANILNKTFTEVGFGIANSANFDSHGHQTVVVAMYASPYLEQIMPLTTTHNQKSTTPSQVTTPPKAEPKDTANDSASSDLVASEEVAKVQDTLTPANNKPTQGATEDSQSIARIQLLSGTGATWTLIIVASVIFIGGSYYIIKHGRAWRRVIVNGEKFVLKHKLLDVVIIVVIVGCIMLTQSVGFIK